MASTSPSILVDSTSLCTALNRQYLCHLDFYTRRGIKSKFLDYTKFIKNKLDKLAPIVTDILSVLTQPLAKSTHLIGWLYFTKDMLTREIS